MANARARIGVILGSSSDLPFVKRCEETLDSFGEPHELIVASAHRTPDLVRQWAEGAMGRGLRAIVAAAGASAALPGVVAAHTTLPVVGLPLDTSPLRGTDSLHAIAQMPPGVPVAAVGINCAENAALLALAIVATSDPALRWKLDEYRRKLRQKIADANEDLYAQRPQVRPQAPNADETAPMAAELEDTKPSFEEPGGAPRVFVPRTTSPDAAGRRLKIDPERPSIEA
ncbi:MAG: 5-(carboxyamino)imidazole ribonucleotide mutase, partial [Candidatus Sumerlaeota bacterium]|nr:5-(carboxyamino)imidazole ribonucleotide mutase [Candidatus Sumerlaeota bacterium]